MPVLVSPRTDSPFACGWFRPAVVLPEGLSEEIASDQLRAVLAHEALEPEQALARPEMLGVDRAGRRAQPRKALHVQRIQDLVLVAEVRVQRAGRVADRVRDAPHRDALVALVEEQMQRGARDLRARRLARALGPHLARRLPGLRTLLGDGHREHRSAG